MAQLPEGETAPLDGSLPTSVIQNSANKTLHAYLHIPFCRVRCGYCDFNTYTATELRGVTQGTFLNDLLSEIRYSKQVLNRAGLPVRKFSTVFFGGGTPTQLSAEQLVSALSVLRDEIGIAEGAEVTTEANPDNVDFDYLAALKAGGFNRISLGMQSAVSSVLQTLDRTHNPDNVAKAVSAAKTAGLQVSVDLIYGTPGESVADWRASLEAAIEIEPDHISAYSLIVEDGTKLARQIRNGDLPEPDEDEQAEKYELANELLSASGFEWYEVSNFSKSVSSRSAHNLAYWQSNDWWGYGPGAHSHVGGVRWWNVKHPATFAQKIADGHSPALAREVLSEKTRLTERILLEVRTRQGLEVDVAKALNPMVAKPISQAIADGLVDAHSALNGTLVLTLKGRLLADALVRDLLG